MLVFSPSPGLEPGKYFYTLTPLTLSSNELSYLTPLKPVDIQWEDFNLC
jgi:hypothetical protein